MTQLLKSRHPVVKSGLGIDCTLLIEERSMHRKPLIHHERRQYLPKLKRVRNVILPSLQGARGSGRGNSSRSQTDNMCANNELPTRRPLPGPACGLHPIPRVKLYNSAAIADHGDLSLFQEPLQCRPAIVVHQEENIDPRSRRRPACARHRWHRAPACRSASRAAGAGCAALAWFRTRPRRTGSRSAGRR
jgi:hypothetical protein